MHVQLLLLGGDAPLQQTGCPGPAFGVQFGVAAALLCSILHAYLWLPLLAHWLHEGLPTLVHGGPVLHRHAHDFHSCVEEGTDVPGYRPPERIAPLFPHLRALLPGATAHQWAHGLRHRGDGRRGGHVRLSAPC